jgi:presenilin-like A22 family membrane protease
MLEYRQLANILAMFLIVQLAGVLLAFYLISPAVVSIITGGVTATTSPDVLLYFAYMLVAAVIMVLLFRAHHGVLLFQIIEGVVVVTAAFYLFLIILGSVLPQDSIYPIPISLLSSVALVLAKNRWPGLRNFTAVIASVGVGLVMGVSFSFFAAYILMALIAVYDYVAVFITKHMIALGRETVNRNLAFMIGTYDVEVFPKGYLKEKEKKEFSKAFSKTKSETLKRLIKEGNVPMPSFSALGAGDLAIPLMLEVSAYVTYLSYFMSIVIVIGAAFGLIFAMWVSKKYKLALPAIPPLFAFVSMALSIFLFFSSRAAWQSYVSLMIASIAILALIMLTAKRQSASGSKNRILPPH